MAHPSEPTLRVLHALRLAGFAPGEAVAFRASLPLERVDAVLARASLDGLARYRQGTLTGWLLTPQGRALAEGLVTEELDALGARTEVEAAYADFLVENPGLLDLCARWQVRDPDTPVLNDHTDPAYDGPLVDELIEVHCRTRPVWLGLGQLLERFEGYDRRFADALERVRAGEQQWFAKPTIDSFHTVWFELHEDLLTTLGLDRASEQHQEAR